ncbi:MAG: hypothetical protein WCY47_06810, partial [Pusillimonas sp.]
MNETGFGSGVIFSFCASGRIRSGPTCRAGWAGCILAVVLAVLPISLCAESPPDPEAAVSTTRHTLAEATQFMV